MTVPTPLARLPLAALLLAVLASPGGAGARPAAEVRTLAGPLDGAVGGVAVDRLGFVYVADFGEKVWKISPWGEVEVLADSLYTASGNAVAPDGGLLQSEFQAGRVRRIERDGTVSTVAAGLAGPVGVAVGADGEIFVCECRGNRIARIATDGAISRLAEGDLFNCPNGITIDGDGNLYVANFSDGRVIRIPAGGGATLLATVPGGGNGHLVRVGDDLYVTAFRANRIFRVTPESEVIPFAGTGAFGQRDGPAPAALFATPNGIAYSSTRDALYVNDYLSTWSERFEGRTRPSSTVREILLPTLEQVAAESFAAGGTASGKSALAEFVRTHPGRPYEPILNRLGYARLQAGRIDEAIAVFELATELFPKSFNTWDSLAEAQLAAGDRPRAIENYRRSLALNPDNANAKAKLGELGAR